jgi:hypothetical protein
MAKGIVLRYDDVDPGADDMNIVLLATVLFVGATVPNGPLIDRGALENGIPIPINISTLSAATYSNAVETALKARAVELGFTLANTDVLMPTYTRGT